jgi:hypothetical protein
VQSATLTGAVDRALDRFINALTDVRGRDRAVFGALAGYLLVWVLYAVVAKNNQDLHPDMTELIAWSRDLAFGYPKHPPFAAIVVRGWFAVFPIADWTYYLLAILTATVTLWIGWQLFADYLDPRKRVIAVVLLMFIPFFNFHALKFNVNTVLMPLWAVTTLWFLRSYRTNGSGYAALAGFSAAFCVTGKYWSIFLIAGLFVAALSDSRRSSYFRSTAPWITVLTGLAVLSPHLDWLERHNFSPIQYAMAVHGSISAGDVLWANLRYLLHSLGYVALPIAVVLLAVRPSLKTMADMAWPADRDRRLLAVAFWTTLLLPIVPALVWGLEIHAIWSMPTWILLPVLLLSPPAVQTSPVFVRWLVGSAVAVPVVILLAAPGIGLVLHERGILPEQTHIRMLARHTEQAWREATAGPLRFVGGDGDLARGVLTYAPSRPEALSEVPRRQTNELKNYGAAFVCFADESACVTSSNNIASQNPASRKIETQLVRKYFGIPGQPRDYVIFIMPATAPAPEGQNIAGGLAAGQTEAVFHGSPPASTELPRLSPIHLGSAPVFLDRFLSRHPNPL